MINTPLLALPAFVFATTSLAILPRQVPSGPCANFAGGINKANGFSLAALNRTLPNANNTGAPLVLGQGGAIEDRELEVLSTWFSFPFNDWPTLSLVNGGLIANKKNSGSIVTVSNSVSNGSEISFTTTARNPPAAAQVYCVVVSTDPSGHSTGFPALALNGQTDLFSLCLTGTSPTAQNNVIYNATADNFGAYIFNSCYPVTIQVVGLAH